MYMLFLMSMIIFLISFMVMILTNLLSNKNIEDREKSSPFECGFDPISSSRLPFSLRFFLIAVIFLIFDVEIALILPMTIIPFNSSITFWSITSITFLSILTIGLYHEWMQGSLEWAT
uniref:NADH-ubiquinone oxidoreductase chain 3 n=1 Tax=Pliacanthopus bimaculatus TaxID=2775419 RepID=A0A7L8EZB1_9NEOP|nr:NADH dehydrogenase subunit 3 [Pliacanthopus bimaculatus]ASY97905.1 NADH dehydrogenase subunit 3 [Miromantis yunnanensis]QOE17726.1 NADH dehydrogenase subunit 3 [Pliacanthopus bimaculatus]